MPTADRRIASLLAASAAAHLMVLATTGWHERRPPSSEDTALQVSLLMPAAERRSAGATSARAAPHPIAAHPLAVRHHSGVPVTPETLVTQPSDQTGQDQFGSEASRDRTSSADAGHERQSEAAIQAYSLTLHDRLMQALRAHFFYPLLARREGWQGAVRLLLHVEPDGRISNTQVVHTSGYAVLDDAAMRSVREIATLRMDDAPFGATFFDLSLTVVYRLTDG